MGKVKRIPWTVRATRRRQQIHSLTLIGSKTFYKTILFQTSALLIKLLFVSRTTFREPVVPDVVIKSAKS